MVTKGKRAAIYLRVSTSEQTVENQRIELERVAAARGWEIVQVYEDKGISGAKFGRARPALQRLRKDATRRKFDIVMAWHIDRVGRSTAQVAAFMAEMDALGVAQFYYQQGLDASTIYGRGMIQMALVFAEIERGLIQERVRAGLQRAKERGTASGRPIGRPKALTSAQAAEARSMRAKGQSLRNIAAAFNTTAPTIARILKGA